MTRSKTSTFEPNPGMAQISVDSLGHVRLLIEVLKSKSKMSSPRIWTLVNNKIEWGHHHPPTHNFQTD